MAIVEKATRDREGVEASLTSQVYMVQDGFEFLRDFVSEIKRAKTEIGIKCMTIQAGHAPELILHAVEKASARGIDSKIIKDSHSEKVVGGTNSFQQELNTLRFNNLEKAGVSVAETNPPKGFFPKLPFIGKYSQRDHRKIYFVDDTVWVGGMNLDNSNFNNIDLMVKIKNPEVVKDLMSIFQTTLEPESDYEINPNEETRILVDVGNLGKSIIMDEAIKTVNDAKESIRVFSMLLPDGKLLKALEKARKRGVKVDVITSKSNELNVALSRLVQTASQLRYKAIHEKKLPIYVSDKFVHAKYLGVDGKTAMFGSHNLSGQGVFLGTEEIEIITTNPGLVAQLENFFQEELEKSLRGRNF